MESDPRERFDDLQELRFHDDPEDEPQPEPDERTTFDPARFDVFDVDPDAGSDLVFTPEPDNTPAPKPAFQFDIEPAPEQPDLNQPDWWTAPADPDPIDDDTPFELLTLDVFDDDEDGLG